MERVISATEARIRLGEWMRRAAEQGDVIIVARSGQPYVVMLSYEAYRRLQGGEARPAWEETLERILALRAQIRKELGDRQLPPPEEIIRQMREERDAQIMEALGFDHLP